MHNLNQFIANNNFTSFTSWVANPIDIQARVVPYTFILATVLGILLGYMLVKSFNQE